MSEEEKKADIQVSIQSVHDSSTPETPVKQTFWSKVKFHVLNVERNPAHDNIFDDEPYTVDNLLEQEGPRLEKANAPRWKKVIGFVWDPIFLQPSERKYLAKVDFFIFFYGILALFIKELDQSSINNAYVSGMKEDLNMYGANDYNLLTTYFNIGYLSFSIFMTTMMKSIRPSVLIPSCELIWSIIVMAQSRAKTKQVIFGLRVAQGALEASTFPGLSMIIGEYYSVEGIAKKMFMMNATGAVAGMFSGYIQAAAYKNLNGVHGYAGWQWVMIIDGVISLPIALLGYYCIPDFPENTRAHWMSKKDVQFALARAKRNKRVKPRPMTPKTFLKAYTNWKLWVFLGPYVIGVIGSNHTKWFSLYLKSLKKYSIEQINLIPTAQNGWQFICMFLLSAISDYTGNRIIPVTVCALIGLTSTIILSIWNVPFGAKIFAYVFGSGAGAGQTIVISWFAETYYDEPDLKAINIGTGNTIIYAFNAFLPLAIYKTKDAPHFPFGYKVSLSFYCAAIVASWIFWYTARVYTRNRTLRELEELKVDDDELYHRVEKV